MSTLPSLRSTTAALLSAAALLAGCGSSSKSSSSTASSATTTSSAAAETAAFKAGYENLRTQLNLTGDAIAKELTTARTQTDAQVEHQFAGLASRWGAQVAHLSELKPPPSLASPFATVTRGANHVESQLRAIANAAADHNSSAARTATEQLLIAAAKLRTTTNLIKAKLGIS